MISEKFLNHCKKCKYNSVYWNVMSCTITDKDIAVSRDGIVSMEENFHEEDCPYYLEYILKIKRT